MISMYVSSHINALTPTQPYFIPIQVGSAQKEPWPGYLSDNTGDHISEKNDHFGELTALYWVWKNTQNDPNDKIGWCHYRRFFSPVLLPPDHMRGVAVDLPFAQSLIDYGNEGRLFELELDLAHMIVPTKLNIVPKEFYDACHRPHGTDAIVRGISFWDSMMRAINDVYPEEYQAVHNYMNSQQGAHFWCCFMTRRYILDQYCEWIFKYLFHLEATIQPRIEKSHERVCAFFSEMLFPYWTLSRGLKLIERPILLVNQPPRP